MSSPSPRSSTGTLAISRAGAGAISRKYCASSSNTLTATGARPGCCSGATSPSSRPVTSWATSAASVRAPPILRRPAIHSGPAPFSKIAPTSAQTCRCCAVRTAGGFPTTPPAPRARHSSVGSSPTPATRCARRCRPGSCGSMVRAAQVNTELFWLTDDNRIPVQLHRRRRGGLSGAIGKRKLMLPPSRPRRWAPRPGRCAGA